MSSLALCHLYGPLSFLWPRAPLQPSVLSTSPCLFYSPFPFCPCKAIYPLKGPVSPQQPSVPFMAHCPLYGPLSPLRTSVPSMALVFSAALCPLYDRLKNSETSKTTSLVSWNILWNVFHQNTKGYSDPFRIRDNQDHRDNRDNRSSKILSDNLGIAIIALTKKVAIITIITPYKNR